jgi:hypothetical protein
VTPNERKAVFGQSKWLPCGFQSDFIPTSSGVGKASSDNPTFYDAPNTPSKMRLRVVLSIPASLPLLNAQNTLRR